MDRFEDDILLLELRSLRPTPRSQFAAELDERAAAGFPRRESRAGMSLLARLLAHWQAMTPRRRLIPVLGVALVALVAATTVIATRDENDGTRVEALARVSPAKAVPAHPKHGPTEFEAPPEDRIKADGAGAAKGSRANETSSEAVFEAEAPAVESLPAEKSSDKVIPFSATVPSLRQRDIERSASVVLSTKPGGGPAAAAKVYAAVHAADGVVLHSSVQSGSQGATGASFDLLIPSRKLGGALATLSSIAEVRSRHDATTDITEPTVTATEELADSNAAIAGLLKELADVEAEAERESVEARLHEERRHHAAIRASLDHLHERAAMSEVTVRIVTGHGSGVTPAGKGSGDGWGIGDALHDAGRVLTIALGVILVALAVLAPIALIALALWLANRFRLRRLRERALG